MISDLIDRLSKLDAPDREVDALIVAELEPHIFDAPGFTPIRPIPSFHIDPQGDAIRFDGGGIMCLSDFPRYTASVDAVIALAERVLPGKARKIVWQEGKAIVVISQAARLHVVAPTIVQTHSSAAIAACIAILRAKEASNA